MAKFSGRLARAPIVYALCQVKFPTVGPIDESLAEAVHRSLRADYPYRIPQDITEISMAGTGGVPPTTVVRRSWLLSDRGKASGYVFDSTSAVYRTAAYRDFEHFVDATMRGVMCMLDAFKPPVIERIGLRFVDLIEGNENGTLDKFIEAPLYGFVPSVEGYSALATQQLIRGKTKQGDLLFRYSRARHAHSLPVDLADPSLSGVRVPNPEQESILIDIDHFRDNADLDPDPKLIRQIILDLQGPMSTLFKDAVTPFAIKQWTTP